MKALLYILPLLFVLPLTGLAQNDSIVLLEKEQPTLNNQMDFDVEVLAISLGYKRKIAKNWLVGPSIGLGLSLQLIFENVYDFNKTLPIGLEIIHFGVSFKYLKTNKLQFEIEPRYSFIMGFDGGAASGVGLGFGIYQGQKLQIGLKTMVGYFIFGGDSEQSLVLSTSLLILRVPIKW